MEYFDEDTGEVLEQEQPAVTKDKHEAFAKLMNRRVTEARKYCRLIGNLSARSRYSYSKEQVDRAFTALEEALADARSRFRLAGPKQGDLFKL